MDHKDIILNVYGDQWSQGKVIPISNKKDINSFTFSGLYHRNKIFKPALDRVVFTNYNYCNYSGISIGQSYTILKFVYFVSGLHNIQIGIKNDFGENKFYPRGAFTFTIDEFS